MENPSQRSFSLAQIYFRFMERRKTSDKLLFNLALLAFVSTVLVSVFAANALFTKTFPTSGGALIEGVVGTPRFVNPVIALNRADHDMVALIYSGLMRLGADGTLVPDLAESITLSEDKKNYTVILKQDNQFHNGRPLTARDVLFTIGLVQNPELKSPLRGAWDGVVVEVKSDYEFTITLPEAHAPFMENLTLGILPRELWDELPLEQIPFSQNNTEPVGSGPYTLKKVLRNKSGLINGYELEAFKSTRGAPNITSLTCIFYNTEAEVLEALRKREITSTPSLSLEQLSQVDESVYAKIEAPLPRTFGVYFNQNKSSVLRDVSVRKALSVVVDRSTLVENILHGYGSEVYSPIPPGFELQPQASTTEQHLDPLTRAESILREGGWSKNANGIWEKEIDKNKVTLSFTIATANTPLFDTTATEIAQAWKALGAEVNVAQFEQTDLVQSIIRPRDFEALLFGADIGRSLDLYPFWHSSQKNDPGLNIAQYTNIETDALLRKMRNAQTTSEQIEYVTLIERMLKDDMPAVFLFAPSFVYVADHEIRGIAFNKIGRQSERFATIEDWHIKSRSVWPIFSDN
jgi:peptide/nickel transport system substrate-binding protein